MNIEKKIVEIRVMPALGDKLDEFEVEAKELAKRYSCRVKFTFNSWDFICNSESCVQVN